mmetsp:Transcript_4904/g.6659  ORF Transcript_4904/g.6659 Transcript_4904/m.6659 type:complete len:196 (+) Transcript_4904:163-750(+)
MWRWIHDQGVIFFLVVGVLISQVVLLTFRISDHSSFRDKLSKSDAIINTLEAQDRLKDLCERRELPAQLHVFLTPIAARLKAAVPVITDYIQKQGIFLPCAMRMSPSGHERFSSFSNRKCALDQLEFLETRFKTRSQGVSSDTDLFLTKFNHGVLVRNMICDLYNATSEVIFCIPSEEVESADVSRKINDLVGLN